MGGGWNDPIYVFHDVFAQPAFDRSETNGFRCIKYMNAEEMRAELQGMIPVPFRDFASERPVSDEVFAAYLAQYDYDDKELDSTKELGQESEDWILEKVTFNAAYGGERMSAFLFLPRNARPPYQTVIYFPGSYALVNNSSDKLVDNMILSHIDMFPKTGRAVLYPIYKSTYERTDDMGSDYPDETALYRDHVIMWAKDLSRSIDYLETRSDIAADKLAYYGFSWGGSLSPILLAVEKRLKVGVLYVSGLVFQRSKPEVEPIHYLPRVTQPVRMINGAQDFFFPYSTSQKPLYDLLGTPSDDKDLFVYPRGHIVPRAVLVEKTLDWLDTYLGPVE
jgi:dienelactone hydrolase